MPKRGCPRCGDPYVTVDAGESCKLCRERDWADGAREKVGPEEMHATPDYDQEVDEDGEAE